MRLAIALATFALPLAIAPAISFYYDVVPKFVILLLTTAIALTVAACDRRIWLALFQTPARRTFTALVLGSMLAALVAAAVSSTPELAWHGSGWRRFGAIGEVAVLCLSLLVTGAVATEPARGKAVLRWITLAGMISAVYGIAQYFGWDPLLAAGSYHAGEGPFRIVRTPGTLGHSDYYSAWLLWPIFSSLALLETDQSARWRRLALVTAVLASAAMLLSGSRGALAGLAVGLAVLAAKSGRRLRPLGAAAAVVVVAAALFLISPAGAKLRARAYWITDEPFGGARLLLWQDSLKMARRRPLFGFGPDAFVAEFPQHQSQQLARLYPDFYHESPHNALLDRLTGEGVVGLMFFGGILLLALVTATRAARDEADARVANALFAAIAAAVVAHQFSVLTIPSAVCLYIGVGILVVLTSRAPAPASGWRWGGGVTLVHAIPVALFAAYAVGVFVIDHQLALARRSLEAGRIDAAVSAYSNSRTFPYFGVNADLYLSRLAAAGAASAVAPTSKLRYAAFANTAAAAASSWPEQRANAWYNRAGLAATRADAGAVATDLREAILAAPNWFKPHWALARVLYACGREQEAAAEARRAGELDANRHREVTESVNDILRSASVRTEVLPVE